MVELGKYSKSVLIVEDDSLDASLISERLRVIAPSVQAVIVTSIYEAYKVYKVQNFDLVLLDLNLPDGIGANSVAEMKRFNRNIPIVVLTGMSNDDTVNDALKFGADCVFTKAQIDEKIFQETLCHFLGE